jgi:4a-hydroxytetrahydrobiopterin dehydratase
MTAQTAEELRHQKCKPCEGGVKPLNTDEVRARLDSLHDWQLSPDGKAIRRQWTARDFMAAIDFFNRIAELAEDEGHHPDLHLQGYRKVTVELSTHAIGGLSENDFILAAKIDQLPIAQKK